MAGTGLQFNNRIASVDKVVTRGLYACTEGIAAANQPPDRGRLDLATGSNGIADISPVAGTYVLIPAYSANNLQSVPQNFALDITNLRLWVTGATSWNGTAGTVSLTLQGTDGTNIATFTAAALAGSANLGSATSYSIAVGSTLASGVLDPGGIRTIGATLAKGVGLQVVVSANSTAGSPVRLSIDGRYLNG